MNTRQQIAYDRPSAEGEDTQQDRFGWFTEINGRRIRLHLTANVGRE